ncbi:aminoacyl-tRNA hydrolase [Candidatus Wolfebacteria bacterium]|nr:aminoacyl-tRNA hydrolase [Candidatus Wolfebacteria bacterium]
MAYTIIGLGNPGGEYTNTKHNVGRMVVTLLADTFDIEMKAHTASNSDKGVGIIEGEKVTLLSPNTFMNKSGSAVLKIVKSVKAAQKMIVIYDDLDLPLGKIKISYGGGSGGHKGVDSIMRGLKTKDFIRLRIGISATTPGGKIKKPKGEDNVIKHLMGDFGRDKTVWNKVKKKTREAVELILANGQVIAQNEINSWR